MWHIGQVVVACFQLFIAGRAVAPILTPAQIQYLADINASAVIASKAAEEELLSKFRSAAFHLELIRNGAWQLASTPPAALLAQLRETLRTIEYTTNFGVDPAWRMAHPGEPALGIDTIEQFGYIPNMWELRSLKSPLVNGTPDAQWSILEAAERGIYELPLTSAPLPIGPNRSQASERPQYIAGNLRRIDIGVARYGAYAAVLRNDVVRERAAIIATDSGGWENACNSSVAPISRWMPVIGHVLTTCTGVKAKGNLDHQLHVISTNTKEWRADSLARLMYQLLTPTATAAPLETLYYTEVGVLGHVRPQDIKLLVASFPGLFGTAEAWNLRLYCIKHRLPLAWAFHRGETWAESTSNPSEWLPYAPAVEQVGAARLLDPETAMVTNATRHLLPSWRAVWNTVFSEIEARHNSTKVPELQPVDFKAWWNRLADLGGEVQTLRPGECQSADLCFGTIRTVSGTMDCVCREVPQSEAGVANTDAVSGFQRSPAVATDEQAPVII